jgi:hypothetical protein
MKQSLPRVVIRSLLLRGVMIANDQSQLYPGRLRTPINWCHRLQTGYIANCRHELTSDACEGPSVPLPLFSSASALLLEVLKSSEQVLNPIIAGFTSTTEQATRISESGRRRSSVSASKGRIPEARDFSWPDVSSPNAFLFFEHLSFSSTRTSISCLYHPAPIEYPFISSLPRWSTLPIPPICFAGHLFPSLDASHDRFFSSQLRVYSV